MLLTGAQAVAQDIRRCRKVLYHKGIARIIPGHDGIFAPVVFVVVRNNADSLHAEELFHIAHVVERGVHQQFDHGKAHAGRKAQQRQEHEAVVAASHDADLFDLGLVDDLKRAELQRLGQDIACVLQHTVPDSKTFFRVTPGEAHFEDLGAVVLRDGDGVSQGRNRVAQQFVFVDDLIEHTLTAHHVAHRVHHILGQMEVVCVRNTVTADILTVDVLGGNGKGAVDVVRLIRGLHNCHRGQDHAEGQSHQRKCDDDHPTLLQRKEQITHTYPYYAVLRCFIALQG